MVVDYRSLTLYHTGLRLNVSNTLDLTQADVLSYQASYVDVYSNSWGPSETGFTVGGPGYVTQRTLKRAIEQVSACVHSESDN